MTSKLRKFFKRHSKSNSTTLPVAPGDVPTPLAPGRKVQPEEIRDLGELIRKRYKLDVEIWTLRHVRPRDRSIVEDKMKRSDAILQKIRRTIYAWDSPAAFSSQRDYERWQDIKVRIEAAGKRDWAAHPPWEDI
ncbi:MAG: hypothetical protein M1839_000416 [Geoglossum umbratile]|nr:MAG: hypothetical protein M1839_000416 [Geoglossum umbratile]